MPFLRLNAIADDAEARATLAGYLRGLDREQREYKRLESLAPAVLAWLLKEVPLRTTVGPVAELSSEQAPAAATPEERLQPPAARRAGAAR